MIFILLGGQNLRAASVSGQVADEQSGEYIAGASVYLKLASDTTANVVAGRTTNSFGLYSLTDIPSGDYKIYVKSIGYRLFSNAISIADSSVKVDIRLSASDIQSETVTVVGERFETETIKNISTVEIEPSFIKRMPAIGGEVDIFRTLQLLPGISSANELSSGLYVRGGSPDQNLILLDGVIVYNPSHLGGLFSTFNNDALRDIKLIKGAFPAQYGGRVSSVLDLTMKEGAKDELHGAGGISLIASRLTLEGPITDDISFMVSGRRSYLDLMVNKYTTGEEEFPQYYIYDFNAKTNWRIDENNHLYLSGYFGADVFDFESEDESDNIGINWGNKTANLRWLHIVSPELFTNFSLIYTDFSFNTFFSEKRGNGSEETGFESLSQIRDLMVKGNADYFPHPDHEIKFGIEAILHDFTIDANQTSNLDDLEELDFFKPREESAIETSLYLQDEWSITQDLTTNLGARLYYFNRGDYFFAEPRMSLSYDWFEGIQLKAAATIGHQFLHLVVRNDIPLPTDLWFPSTENIKPQRAYQAVLGAERTFLDGEFLISVEGYYKQMENLLEFQEDAQFTLGVPDDEDFAVGTGEAYGIEVFINKRMGDLTGWIGYTLGWTQRQFEDINNGNPFFPRYDRRHDVSLTLNYSFSENWEIGGVWVFATGQAFTMPQGQYFLDPNLNPNPGYEEARYDYTERNGYRLPAYHRLDLNIMWKHKIFDDGLGWLSINLYNVYNRQNPFAQYIGSDYDFTTGQSTKSLKQFTLFPFIPTIAYNFEF